MLSFRCVPFQELTRGDLYEILALRAAVFVVEQDCCYQDIDGKDQSALHLLGKTNDELVAYARILPKGIAYLDALSIGRILTHGNFRGKDFGHQLVKQALHESTTRFPGEIIKISAQAHLENFYNSHHFVHTGESYLEDGIPHISMRYHKSDLNK